MAVMQSFLVVSFLVLSRPIVSGRAWDEFIGRQHEFELLNRLLGRVIGGGRAGRPGRAILNLANRGTRTR
jgi:hypothetical protein